MTLDRNSKLPEVVGLVAGSLSAAEIPAVLTGGACASLHTKGRYLSEDLDFILERRTTRAELDDALGTIGFRRRHDSYHHPATDFFVEFPAGPLAIGNDRTIRPVEQRVARRAVRLLSPTDSCRDRLAAYYFWQDRGSLDVAVEIALRHRILVSRVERWSRAEGHLASFQIFLEERARARASR